MIKSKSGQSNKSYHNKGLVTTSEKSAKEQEPA